MNVIKMVFMVNSLKHALELPRSSAMNNQDKCDPDWVGWHVFYGVLIPLYIVVGFSCSKTKHRTSLSVATGRGAESSTHFTASPSSNAVSKEKRELRRGASLSAVRTVPLSCVTVQGHCPVAAAMPALPACLNPDKAA